MTPTTPPKYLRNAYTNMSRLPPNDPKVLAEVDAWFRYLKPARELRNLERQRSIVLRIHRELQNNITGPTIVGWLLKELRVKQASAWTVCSYRETMQAYLNWRHEFRGGPKIDVKLTIQRPSEPMPSMTEEEYKWLLERLEHPMAPLWYGTYWPYAIRMGWYTGQRLSDIACCRWIDLSWADKCIRLIPIKTSRRGLKVEIPLPDEFLDWLRAYRETQDQEQTVMNAEMHALQTGKHPSTLSQHFRELVDSVEIDKTFHAFRHGYVTRMLAQGVSPGIITKITGQNLEMIARYNSPTSEMLRSALGYDKPQIEVLNQPKPNEEETA